MCIRYGNLIKAGLFAVAAVWAVLGPGPCLADNASGFQWWSTVELKTDLNTDWSTAFEEEFRIDADRGKVYYHQSDIGLTYKGLAEWLDVGLNFRKVYQQDDAGDWRQENRPHVNLTVKDTFSGIKWSNRSRVEFRDIESRHNFWRYRNKTTLELPWELTALKLKPYVADEVYINLDGSGYSRNRFSAGGLLNLTRSLKLDIYYLWQSTVANGGTDTIHALGTKLALRF
ncbi:MAG: DUF2490 domain-containing protein [Phycisphaerae bacterium]|nr:DUF2490 domain-containing protein [Phycisphaerae bacterium]